MRYVAGSREWCPETRCLDVSVVRADGYSFARALDMCFGLDPEVLFIAEYGLCAGREWASRRDGNERGENGVVSLNIRTGEIKQVTRGRFTGIAYDAAQQ